MGIYTEKKKQLIEKIKILETRIASGTAKKKTLEDKFKEVSRLAMAEEYNCKPKELDEIISSEHQLLEKLRASGLSDADLLELVGNKSSDTNIPFDKNDVDSNNHYADDEDDDISFYADSGNDED